MIFGLKIPKKGPKNAKKWFFSHIGQMMCHTIMKFCMPGLDLNMYLHEKFRWLVMNRFCWELPESKSLRVRSALQIGSIVSAQRRNIRTDQPDGVLSLLALRFEAEDAPAGTVSIIFSGGGEIRLAVEACEAILEDITEPWAATRRPAHDANA